MSSLVGIKVGAKVLVSSGGWNRDLRVAEVEKVGKVHLQLKGISGKIRINSGNFVGSDSWSRTWVRPFDQAEYDDFLADRRDRTIRNVLAQFDWHKCDKEFAEKVYAILPKGAKEVVTR